MSAKHSSQQGFILPALLASIIALSIIIVAVAQVINSNFSLANTNNSSQKAFNIAEAGINYYLWHLSHNQTDYKDGKSTPATPDPQLGYGPYVHDYIGDDATKQGTFTLYINPGQNGSSLVRVRSIGKDLNNVTRTIEAQIGAPSFASYGLVTDSQIWFGNDEAASGPVHSNVGIRMDGASTTDVTASNTTYVPSSSFGGNGSTSRPGVWCSTAITTPINCNTRSKVDWRYPVPTVDFNQVTSALCNIKKTAFAAYAATSALASLATACSQTPTTRTNAYLPQRSATGSYNLTQGYLIELNSNGTYNLYNVNGENDTQTPYTSALTRTLVASNLAIGTDGVIFAEDNVWVRTNPTFAGRVTIAAGRLATTNNAQMVVADDVLYSTKNGSDAIGLISEGSFIIAPYAPPSTGNFNFEIDAAIIAQTGDAVFPLRYRYNNAYTRGWIGANQRFTFYGSVATRQTWTWLWTGLGSGGNAVYDSTAGSYIVGFKRSDTQYDYNLQYAAPPSYPITSSYNILSWREVVTQP